MSFLLLLLVFPFTQDLFLPKFLARIGSLLDVFLQLQAGIGLVTSGRSPCYLAIIENPGKTVPMKWSKTRYTEQT